MRPSIATALLSLVLLASCGQGEGDRCQAESDCPDDLVCHETMHVCSQRPTGGDIDGSLVTEDAPPIPDAAFDSTEDATPDASGDASGDASPDASDASPDA